MLLLASASLTSAQAQEQPKSTAAAPAKETVTVWGTDIIESIVPKKYPRPKSAWIESERALYLSLLGNTHYDVLVAPVQMQDRAFDRATRSLMTAILAQSVEDAGAGTVPDTYAVARAVGENARHYPSADVYAVIYKMKPERLLWTLVGHDGNGLMTVSFGYHDKDPDGTMNAKDKVFSKKFDPVPFSDERPPIEVFEAMLPDLLRYAGMDPKALAKPKRVSKFDITAMPASPIPSDTAAAEPARDAYQLQLLGMLAPASSERLRERLFEKSLLAVRQMSPDSPSYKALKARAYMHLGLRPAALHVLANSGTPEEKEIQAALNGNLPQVEAIGVQAKSQVLKLFALIDAIDMRAKYNVEKSTKNDIEAVEALKLPGDSWKYLALRKATEWDVWSTYNNLPVKQLLDQDFPVPGFTADSLVRAGVTSGGISGASTEIHLSVLNHVQHLLKDTPAKWCCRPAGHAASPADYLEVLAEIGIANLVSYAKFQTRTQGSGEAAREFLDQVESAFKDHPQFAIERAQAQYIASRGVQGAARDGLLKSAYENAFNAYFWEQGQTRTATDAWNALALVNRHDYGYIDNFYVTDFPFHSYYVSWVRNGGNSAIDHYTEARLRYSTDDFYPVTLLADSYGDSAKVDVLLKSIDGRFAGNPELPLRIASEAIKLGDTESAKKRYREVIAMYPGYWPPYSGLSKVLLDAGDTEGATALFRAFQPFKSLKDENPVSIAYDAHDAANQFFERGDVNASKEFYKISADLKTGSGNSLDSEYRLAMFDEDYSRAATIALDTGRRYNGVGNYTEYIDLLHLTGRSKLGWETFEALAPQMPGLDLWSSAHTGHQIAGAGEAEIIQWAKQDQIRRIGVSPNKSAANYLVLAGLTDRLPSPALAAAIGEIDNPVLRVKREGAEDAIVRRDESTKAYDTLGPPGGYGVAIPLAALESVTNLRVKSNLVYFAEAYGAMKKGDYAAAAKLLAEASSMFDFSQSYMGYPLPYFALAAAKAGDVSKVESVLDGFKTRNQQFDYALARAAIAAVAGRHADAMAFLKTALGARAAVRSRPFRASYEYAEICEWLFEATAQPRYRDLALDWAKKVQRMFPGQGWAYAMEAKLTPIPADRRRALGFAMYLDRNSLRLSKIPMEERDSAKVEFDKRNPFLEIRKGKERATTS
jgi:tetratricopeptide (TPR) repeat protein